MCFRKLHHISLHPEHWPLFIFCLLHSVVAPGRQGLGLIHPASSMDHSVGLDEREREIGGEREK